MDYLRSVFGKKQIKLVIIGSISLLIGLIITGVCVSVTKKLSGDNMASRWSADNYYAKESVFFSELADYDDTSLREFEYKIDKQLKDDSITVENDGARTWVYTYSTQDKLNVTSKSASAEIKTLAVGKDFFLFHPMNIISGSFFDGTEINDDLVVIDKDAAWILYGSTDIVGQVILIGGKEYVIVGVVNRDEGKLNDAAGNNEATIYISYSSYKEIKGDAYINTIEVLMPNPISEYAYKTVSEAVSASENRFEVVENTHRYYFTKLLKHAKAFGTRGMNAKSIVYPYWENISRGMEDILTPVCVMACIFLLLPAVLLVMLFVRMWRLRTIHKENVKDFIERKIERLRARRHKRNKKGELDEEEF